MAQAFPMRAMKAKSTLANSLERFLKSAEEKKCEVNSKINYLIEIANVQRRVLLLDIENEVRRVEEDVNRNQIFLSQLEKTEIDIDKNLSSNETRHAMETTLSKQINTINLNLPNLKLKWSNWFTRFIENFDLFCHLMIYTESPFDMDKNNTPLWTASLSLGNGDNEVTEAKSIAIDPRTQNIYVGDASGRKILIFNKVGDYVKTLKIAANPSSIGRMLVYCDSIYCYVNSIIRSTRLNRLDKFTGEQIGVIEIGSLLKGLAICDQMLYTSITDAKHILRLTTDLKHCEWFKINPPIIKRGRLWSSSVQDMTSVNGELVMLLSYTEHPIQVFDTSGGLLRSLDINNYSALGEAFLCIDAHWNIIITSSQDKLVHVYNENGREIASVGRAGQDREDMYYPRGVVLDLDGNLIVCDCKKKFLLQAY